MRPLEGLISSRVAQIALVVLLTGAAILLADAEGGRQIADDAAVQRAAESVMSAVAVTDASAQQAMVVARAWELGVSDDDEVRAAEESLRTRLAELETRLTTLATMVDDPAPVWTAYDRYRQQITDVADSLTSGNISQIQSEIDPVGYADLAAVASRIRDERQVHLVNVREGVETVSAAARLFVGLGLPALVLLLVYRGLRNRQRRVILTEELRRERALRRAKDQFLNGASHHLNTPLTAVLGFAHLLNDGHRKFTASERSELVELLAIQAEEAGHVAEDLLIAARSDMSELTLESKDVDLRGSIEAAIQGWDGSELASLQIRGNAVAVGDPSRITQTVRNILRNAVAYGSRTIIVSVSGGQDANMVVTDDGPGIPEEYEEKLFLPYYTRRSSNGMPPSLGLALSVARRLARVMGGDVTFQRESSQNVYTLRLPSALDLPATDLPDLVIHPAATRPTPGDVVQLLDSGGPPIVYQPIFELKAYENAEEVVIGYEGLARFPFSTTDEWFKAAEASELRLALELRCIETGLRDFHPQSEDQFISLNLSEETLGSSRLVTALGDAPPDQVILELSETATIKNYQKTKAGLDRLRQQGVRLAIDDIGAAEIDLWHIVRLEASVVKIDMSLVTDLDRSRSSRGFVRALMAMAEELDILLIGEGVETEQEHRALLELGVPYAQGFYYSRPHPLGAWKTWTIAAE
jgi:EAL domain-containing protein (putative c-di-GMP-specific phosphodiesterase class I)/signal transduction histidine kinase